MHSAYFFINKISKNLYCIKNPANERFFRKLKRISLGDLEVS